MASTLLPSARGERLTQRASLNELAQVATDRKDYDAAAELLDEAMALARTAGEWHFLAVATDNRGYVALALGDYARGVALCEDGFALAREIRSVNPTALTLLNIGFGSLGLGQGDRALKAFRDSVDITRRLGHKQWIAYAAEGLAALYVTTHSDHALSLLAAAAALRASTGFRLPPVEQRCHDATLDTLRAKISTETIDTAYRQARSLELEEIVTIRNTRTGEGALLSAP